MLERLREVLIAEGYSEAGLARALGSSAGFGLPTLDPVAGVRRPGQRGTRHGQGAAADVPLQARSVEGAGVVEGFLKNNVVEDKLGRVNGTYSKTQSDARFLTKTEASATYLTKAGAGVLLAKPEAEATYAKKSDLAPGPLSGKISASAGSGAQKILTVPGVGDLEGTLGLGPDTYALKTTSAAPIPVSASPVGGRLDIRLGAIHDDDRRGRGAHAADPHARRSDREPDAVGQR